MWRLQQREPSEHRSLRVIGISASALRYQPASRSQWRTPSSDRHARAAATRLHDLSEVAAGWRDRQLQTCRADPYAGEVASQASAAKERFRQGAAAPPRCDELPMKCGRCISPSTESPRAARSSALRSSITRPTRAVTMMVERCMGGSHLAASSMVSALCEATGGDSLRLRGSVCGKAMLTT